MSDETDTWKDRILADEMIHTMQRWYNRSDAAQHMVAFVNDKLTLALDTIIEPEARHVLARRPSPTDPRHSMFPAWAEYIRRCDLVINSPTPERQG